MSSTIIAILGGLIGSTLTVIVSKIFDLTQERNKHTFYLRQNYFDRKLSAAEKAAGQFSLMSSSLSNLATIYERFPGTNSGVEAELNRQLIANAQATIQRATDASYELANSISIYFDIDDSEFWDTKPIKDFYDILAKTETLNNRINSLYAHIDSRTEHQELAWQQIDEIKAQLRQYFKEMSEIFSKSRKIYLKILRQMRTEMRKYEPKTKK